MHKKIAAAFCAAVLLISLAGCEPAVARSIGMVTSAGVLEDRSFNQNTWAGIIRAGQEYKLETRHYKPETEDDAGYLAGVKTLRSAGFRLIVTAGTQFKSALESAQKSYGDCRFIAVDFVPEPLADNTAALLFAEQEAAFAAGVAAALKLKKGPVGCVLGEESPPVQRYSWGFQQGILYANKEFGTNITMNPEHFVYAGTFTDEEAARALAARLYDGGVAAIFSVAGGAGLGVIGEAKERALKGQEAWVIGVDVDQYDLGLYDGEHSVVLTSAVKRLDNAVYSVIGMERKGEFPGGQTLVYSAANDGVGLPDKNPNLSEDIEKTARNILSQIKNGEIAVSDTQDELIP